MLQSAGIEVELFESKHLRDLNDEFVEFFERVASDGDVAIRMVAKLCVHLWNEALPSYLQNGSSTSLFNLDRAARGYNWAVRTVMQRNRLLPGSAHLELPGRDAIPTDEQLTAGGWVAALRTPRTTP